MDDVPELHNPMNRKESSLAILNHNNPTIPLKIKLMLSIPDIIDYFTELIDN